MRERLRTLLSAADYEVRLASDAAAAVLAARRQRPDLCLIDIEIPGGGIETVAALLEAAPATTVVVLTLSHHEDDLLDALEAGASGYLLKDDDLTVLPDLLRRALRGEALLNGRMTARLVQELRDRSRRRKIVAACAPEVELTRREWQVLDLLARHLTTSEIAARLFVAPGTVRTHIASVVHKLQVPHRAAALRLLEAREEAPAPW